MSAREKQPRKELKIIYDAMEKCFGDLKWWPADSVFEMIVGAVLTQNTAWSNVEKAIDNLKKEELIDPFRLLKTKDEHLAELIKSAGYFNVKTVRLKNISRFIIEELDGSYDSVDKSDMLVLREQLLRINGVGPETADSILLYAFRKPIFVVDAYTKRIFSRHGLIREDADYKEVQELVHKFFPKEERKLNQFHAFIVETAKNYCKKRDPLCDECPLGSMQGRRVRSKI